MGKARAEGSDAGRRPAAPSTPNTRVRRVAPLGMEFLNFFGVAGVSGLVLAGYAYVNTFYDRFGLGLSELGIGYLDTLEYAAYLVEQKDFAFGALVAALVTSGAVTYARRNFRELGFYLCTALVFLGVVCVAVWRGAAEAHEYADKMLLGRTGKIAYCILRPEADIDSEMRDAFEQVTLKERVRMLHQDAEMVYLFVLSAKSAENVAMTAAEMRELRGQHLAISRKDISHCRVFGHE